MKAIKIPEQETLDIIKNEFLYDPETGVVLRKLRGQGSPKNVKSSTDVNGVAVLVHRVAYFLMTDRWPDKFIDHIDQNHNNNRWQNLRLATPLENVMNISKTVTKNTTSKYKGVYLDDGKWVAQCNSKWLGSFDNEDNAAKMYDQYAKEKFGDFAVLNFSSPKILDNDSPYKRLTEIERFWSKVNKNGRIIEYVGSACWEFTGSINKKTGYGFFKGMKQISAHRYSWILTNGPIPDDMFVCHKCDNRCCVNTDHLFLGTMQDNIDDMHAKMRGGSSIGEEVNTAKLKNEDIPIIRQRYDNGETYEQIVVDYLHRNANVGIIKNVCLRNTWKWVQ